MPNWVFNKVTVMGDETKLLAFRDYINTKPDIVTDDEWNAGKFSFHSFLTPPLDKSDEYHAQNGSGPSGKFGDTEFNWYNWNIANWGCKWDAGSIEMFNHQVGNKTVSINIDFETPWGFPYEAIKAMVEQYPTLTFSIRFLEEQGWGGEALGMNGEFAYTDEWDIPDTHEERMLHIGYCWCEEMRDDEAEYMYDDCPKKIEVANA